MGTIKYKFPKIKVAPRLKVKQIEETMDVFRGEHPDNDKLLQKAQKQRVTSGQKLKAKKPFPVWYRNEKP